MFKVNVTKQFVFNVFQGYFIQTGLQMLRSTKKGIRIYCNLQANLRFLKCGTLHFVLQTATTLW
jgi:hypothetical protein